MPTGLRTLFGKAEAQVEAGLSVACTASLEHDALAVSETAVGAADTALHGGVSPFVGIMTVLN